MHCVLPLATHSLIFSHISLEIFVLPWALDMRQAGLSVAFVLAFPRLVTRAPRLRTSIHREPRDPSTVVPCRTVCQVTWVECTPSCLGFALHCSSLLALPHATRGIHPCVRGVFLVVAPSMSPMCFDLSLDCSIHVGNNLL